MVSWPRIAQQKDGHPKAPVLITNYARDCPVRGWLAPQGLRVVVWPDLLLQVQLAQVRLAPPLRERRLRQGLRG